MGDNEEPRLREGGPSNTGTHVGRQLGDNWRQWETMGKQLETTGDKDRQEGRQRETRGDKTSGRRTHHPTQAHMWRDNGRELGNKTSGRRTHHPTQEHTCGETPGREWRAMGDQGIQDLEKAGTPFKQGNGGRRHRGDKTLRKADTPSNTNAYCEETMGDKGRQNLEKADTPSNTGTCGETVGDNGRQGRGQRRQTYQHRHTCGETMGDKKGRQDVEKADAPSNTGTMCGETMGDNGLNGTEGVRRGDKTSGRRTHHPTQAHMWGENGETRRQEGGCTTQHRHTCGHTMGRHWETRRETSRGASSNKAHMWKTRQRGKSGDKVPWDGGHANQQKGNKKGDIGWETKGDKTKATHLKNALRTP